MDKPKIGLNETEENQMRHYVERLFNPLAISTGIFEDVRVARGTISAANSFVQNIKELKREIVRRYFFMNPDKLDKVLLLIEPKHRVELCKILWNLINADLKISLQFFGVPSSNTRLDRALGYGEANKQGKAPPDLLHLRVILSVLLELPLIYLCEVSPIRAQESLFEYYYLKVQMINVRNFELLIMEFIEKATELLKDTPEAKRIINAYILRINSEDVFINLHVYRGYYELRFSVPSSSRFKISDIFKKMASLKPSFYYYAPAIYNKWVTKICIVGSIKPSSSMIRYKEQIDKKLTSVFSITEIGNHS